jgi:Cu/Ag efflux pump CusA
MESTTLQGVATEKIYFDQRVSIDLAIAQVVSATPIDIQVTGRNADKDLEVAKHTERRLRDVRGAVDVHIQQITDAPEFVADVDRQMAGEIGLTEQQIASTLQ